ncbi:MAG: ABC transporter ATP-binding protein [Lachnospiraceae bacterium]|nr:ABC transporter ATP-binding protein [Lachnospiraceae bacterium]
MQDEQREAIIVSDVSKKYKLYGKPSDRLRDALHLTGRSLYTEHLALDHVDLTVGRGETVGLIGTNGSGKSTILKIITGVLAPTGGTVEVNGRISALLELGAGFNMEYNGIDNIFLNGMMIGFSEEEIKERMDDILSFADIGEYIYQPVRTYSSGMFVRLAFAVAINIDPEILIVDEALSVGDVFFQAKCYHKFEEFKEQGKTILFVSHDLSSISKYCDRAVLLHRGKKLGEGTPKKMIDIYKQVLVGQVPVQAADHAADTNLLDDEEIRARAKEAVEGRKDPKSPAEDTEELKYGNGGAKITGLSLKDDQGRETSAIIKGSVCEISMDVAILRDIEKPIFAFTIKNVLGIEITGTNTMAEKAFLEPVRAGEKRRITFRQRIDLQGGDYLLSFGVTGFEGDDFTVYERRYDALSMTVISDKNTVGYYDMNSTVTVETVG